MKKAFVGGISVLLGTNLAVAKGVSTDAIKALDNLLPKSTSVGKEKAKKGFLSQSERVLNCVSDFYQLDEIRRDVVLPLKSALLKKDTSSLKKLGLNPAISGIGPSKKAFRSFDGINEHNWTENLTLDQYVKSFDSIEYVDVQTDLFTAGSNFRDSANKVKEGTVSLRFDIRGRSGKSRRHDSYKASISVKKETTGWKFTSLNVESGKTAYSKRTPFFAEVTKKSGLIDVPVYLRTEAIRRGGYALSVTDLNGDEYPDIFVGLRDEAVAYIGSKSGVYKRFKTGLEKEAYVKTAVFADFDNDGDQDVVINRFLDSPKGSYGPELDVVAYVNNGKGKFTPSTKQLTGHKFAREPMPSALADFNNDGFLDFYVGYPGSRDFSAFYELTNKKKVVQGLYLNDGKGGFQDFTDNLNPGNKTDYQLKLFPHSSLAVDFDQDHDMDLIVIDDRGNLSPVYENGGKGIMKQSAKKIGIENYGYGMSVTSGDLNNDGVTDLAVTNVHLSDLGAFRESCELNWKDEGHLNLEKGFTTYLGKKKGQFSEESNSLGLDNPGEATGGVVFFDYNNDGLQDIYVVNGLWSGTPEGQELSHLFSTVALKNNKHYGLRARDQFKFMDLLSSFKGKFNDYKNIRDISYDGSSPSLGGYQRNRLYRNNGDGSFTDVAYFENVDSIADGYIAGKFDIDNDGRLDLVLRNADPGTEKRKYPAVQVFHNKSPKKKFVSLTFEGRESNRDAIGLFVIADFGSHKQVQHLEGNSGSMQQARALHFGLGEFSSIKKLEIHWPNGQVVSKTTVKAGSYHFKQPEKKKLITLR